MGVRWPKAVRGLCAIALQNPTTIGVSRHRFSSTGGSRPDSGETLHGTVLAEGPRPPRLELPTTRRRAWPHQSAILRPASRRGAQARAGGGAGHPIRRSGTVSIRVCATRDSLKTFLGTSAHDAGLAAGPGTLRPLGLAVSLPSTQAVCSGLAVALRDDRPKITRFDRPVLASGVRSQQALALSTRDTAPCPLASGVQRGPPGRSSELIGAPLAPGPTTTGRQPNRRRTPAVVAGFPDHLVRPKVNIDSRGGGAFFAQVLPVLQCVHNRRGVDRGGPFVADGAKHSRVR